MRKLSQIEKHTTPHSPNVLVPQHSSRKNAKTNKQKTTEMQKKNKNKNAKLCQLME